MSLDKSEIEKIAYLARLNIHPDQVENYSKELSSIMDMVDQMNAVKTDNIQALAHPLELTARLRPDEVTEENQRETFQEHSPLVDEGYFLVPKVIE